MPRSYRAWVMVWQRAVKLWMRRSANPEEERVSGSSIAAEERRESR